MLEDSDILLGKVAIGRRLLERADALSVVGELERSARGGRRESFGSALVRLGYLTPRTVRELQEAIAAAGLECAACGRRSALAGTPPRHTERCASCGGGPLYLDPGGATRAAAPARPALPVEAPGAPEEEGGGGRTFMELEAPELPSPEPDIGPEPASGPAQSPASAPSAGGSGRGGPRRTIMELDIPALGVLDDEEPVVERTLELEAPDFGTSSSAPQLDVPGLDVPGLEVAVSPDAPTPPSIHPDAERTAAMPSDFERPEWGARSDTGLDLAERTAELAPSAASGEDAFEPFELSGGLRILAPVARGGMGAVFRATGPQGQVLAVKVLTERAAANPDAVARFQRETQVAQNLSHPGIVRVHGGGLIQRGPLEGRPYIVMDFVVGRDLAAWAEETARDPLACARILLPVCEAMDYAHGRGVVHRDLKPGNVLVRRADEAPLICDFGLARYRAGSNLTRTGDILGTPSFMAPEQARGDRAQIGPPTDVYALGAILYFLLVGRPPFVGARTFAVIDKVVKEPPKPPRELNPAVSAALEAVVLKTLSKPPVDRYHTCGALGRALSALL